MAPRRPPSTNLRSRLVKTSKTPKKSARVEEAPDFKQQFLSLLREIPNENGKLDLSDDRCTGLADAFATAGLKLHGTAKTAIDKAHESVDEGIQKFTTDYKTAISQTKTLYDNISYPLAMTRCASTKHSSATIAKHLYELQLLLDHGEKELEAFYQEWKDAWDEEQKLRDELDESDDEDTQDFTALQAEIEATTNKMMAVLDETDDEYTEKLQNASTAMMESIMEE